MTQKLFWADPYQTECMTKITSINSNKIKVDRTIFFAFSGGQESDEGTIGGIKVISAVKQGDKENIIDIEYELEKKPDFNVGDEAEIKINEDKRRKLMKLHSAAHIAYYFIIEKLGNLKIIGSNVSSEKARFDFQYDKPVNDALPEIEEKINNFIFDSHDIIRRADENNPDMWWWICKNWKMPCGGTHVKSTKEIGKVKLKRKNIGFGKERIEITIA